MGEAAKHGAVEEGLRPTATTQPQAADDPADGLPHCPEDAHRDSARIAAEIVGSDTGTDPFVAAVRATRMPMIITNPRLPDNPVVFVNDAFCRLTGYARSEIVGRNCRFLQGPQTDPATVRRIRQAVARVESVEVDIRNHRKGGEPFWNRLLLAPVRDTSGALAYFFASQLDVTLERERLADLESSNAALVAELAGRLREQKAGEDELRFALEAGHFGAWSLDIASGELTTSPTCRKNFGRDPDEPFTYAQLRAAVHPDDSARVAAAVQASIATGADYDIAYRAVAPAGDIRWVQVRARTSVAADGTPRRLAGVSQDITAQRQSERMRQALVDLGDALRDLDDAADIAFTAARILGQTLDVDRAGYGTIDAASETITIERDWNAPGVRSLAGTLHFREYGSYIEDLVRGDTVAFADAEADPRTAATAAALKAISAQAVINMPVTERGETVALFYLNQGTARPWHDAELAFVREVAERTRVASERRRAEIALRASAGRLAFLDALGRHTAAATDAHTVMSLTTRLLGEHMDVSVCAYADMDGDEDGFTIRGDWAAPGSRSIVGRYSLAAFGALAVRSLRAGEPLVINDNRSELPPAEAATFQAIGLIATICMPLVKQGRLTALMAVHDKAARRWRPEELALLREVTERSWAHVERVGAMSELRASEAGLRVLNAELEQRVLARALSRGRIWQVSTELLGVADADGSFSETNPAWQTVLGWSADEIAGRPLTTLLHPDDVEPTRAAYAELHARGRPVLRLDNRYRRKQGGHRWLAWLVVPDEGRLYCSARDVTEQKQAAEALAQAQDSLRQSQKMEAVGQLTGGLAHDFNNLLAAISGSVEMMQVRSAQSRPDAVERYATAARSAVKRAAALTHRLLAFSRRQTLDPRPTDVNQLVAGMEELVQRTVGPGVQLDVVGSAGIWPTLVDPNQLENALLNLCINARDAMPDGGRLTIATANRQLDARAAKARSLAPGDYVSLCVTDTGTGMAPDVIAKAFDPFFTTKPLGEGTGLGLSMVYGFARQSGGQVRIDSQLGRGTTMCIYLPRNGATAERRDLAAVDGEAAAEGGRGEVVLVVDDEPTIRMLVGEVLADGGYTALEAADGPAALKIIASDARIDLLITDVGLPGGLNGRQVADAARAARPGLRVIFITGYAENAVRANVPLAGPLGSGMSVLTKPFEMDALGRKIRQAFEERATG